MIWKQIFAGMLRRDYYPDREPQHIRALLELAQVPETFENHAKATDVYRRYVGKTGDQILLTRDAVREIRK
jgi:hypothetical protein